MHEREIMRTLLISAGSKRILREIHDSFTRIKEICCRAVLLSLWSYLALSSDVEAASPSSGRVVRWSSPTNQITLLSRGAIAITCPILYESAGAAMALKDDGTVVAWGFGPSWDDYVTNVPPDLSNVVSIAMTEYTASAIKKDGTVVEWGQVFYPPPPEATNIVAIDAGLDHYLALRGDGAVILWGGGTRPELNVPPNLGNVVAVSAGRHHNLALRNDGTVIAWGENSAGQTNVPVSATNIVAIAAGESGNLALRSDGKVIGWGYYTSPGYPIPGFTNLVSIAAGGSLYLGLKTDGTLVSSGDTTKTPTGLSNVISIATSGRTSTAIAIVDDLRLTPLQSGNTDIILEFHTFSNLIYSIEYLSDLNSTNWNLLSNETIGGSGYNIQFVHTNALLGPKTFYRIKQIP